MAHPTANGIGLRAEGKGGSMTHPTGLLVREKESLGLTEEMVLPTTEENLR